MKKLVYLAAQLMMVMILFSQSSSPPVLAAPVFAGQQVTAPSSQKMPARIYSSIEEIADSSTQPILLVFFSLVCHVCWDELFEMKDFIEKFSLPVILIGISANETEELQAFASRYSFTYPLIQDRDKKLYRQFKVKLEPYRVILYNHQLVYADDYLLDYQTRRDRAKQCLLNLVSKLTSF